MSSMPSAVESVDGRVDLRLAERMPPWRAMVAALLSVLGVLTIWPAALMLWSLWITDPLKSIGMLVPSLSLFLTLRAWRALGWELRGTWWGLAVLTLTAAAVQGRDRAVVELVLAPSWSTTLPPLSFVAFAYGSGAALLFGGVRLWKAARFPLTLLLLVNPVPHSFSRVLDLPLQHASAVVARGLAHTLGQQLTHDQLLLMFTPDFGMFIAPGCNGIRGAVAMGMLALVCGYLYRFRPKAWVLFVAGGILLGYLFNLLRLCLLVVYYVGALHWPLLRGHAEGADYLIGAVLFFLGAMLPGIVLQQWGHTAGLRVPPLPRTAVVPATAAANKTFVLRAAALASLALLLGAPALKAKPVVEAGSTPVRFPQQLGAYRLQRTWVEKLDTGPPIFWWATYASVRGSEVSVGVSPVLGAHDTLLCHTARGERWVWRGPLVLPTTRGPVPFSAAMYEEGGMHTLEASTLCTSGGCGQWTGDGGHLGLVVSRPALLTAGRSSRPIPVLLRTEATGTGLPAVEVQQELAQRLRDFSRATAFDAFPYRYPGS